MPEIGFMLLAGVVVVQILSTLILNQGINGNVLRSVYTQTICRLESVLSFRAYLPHASLYFPPPNPPPPPQRLWGRRQDGGLKMFLVYLFRFLWGRMQDGGL